MTDFKIRPTDGDRLSENKRRFAELARAAGATDEQQAWLRRLSQPMNIRTHGPARALACLSEAVVLLLERAAEQNARIAELEAQVASKAKKAA